MTLNALLTKKSAVLAIFCCTLFVNPTSQASANSDCLDSQYNLPKGSYLENLKNQCLNSDQQDCVKSLVSYDEQRDILLSNKTSTPWIRDDTRYHFPVVLKGACHWVSKGFDIVMRNDQKPVGTSAQEKSPVYNGFLLKPATPNYYRGFSELYAAAYGDWREKNMNKSITDLHRDCTNISWHWLDESISASCKLHQKVHQVSLENAFSCVASDLELVFVKDELYCLNIWDSMGVALGKAINNETYVDDNKHEHYFESLFRYSGFTDVQLKAILKATHDYMISVNRAGYIADIEGVRKHGQIIFYYLRSSLWRYLSAKNTVDTLLGTGVVGHIMQDGGHLDSVNIGNIAASIAHIIFPIVLYSFIDLVSDLATQK